MTKYVDGIKFITEGCCTCGMPFAMTQDFHNQKLKDHETFYCPKGHPQHYTGKSQEQKLKEQLARKQEQLDAQQARAARLEQQQKQVTRSYKKMRERVKNGVCPCCNRTFQNLMDHMKTEHPDFENQEILRNLRQAYGLSQQGLAEEIGVTAAHISLFERQQPVTNWAQSRIDNWMESHND